jgi:feruloyl esterase
MRRFSHVGSVFLLTLGVVLAVLVATEPKPAAATSCASLSGMAIAGGTITSAALITAPFTTPASSGSALITVSAPFPFCKVTATLTPTSDSEIQMELWMPEAAHWNSKFLGVGNGALTGAIWHTSMVRPLQAGYAVANSNLGHNATNANWALGHPEKVIDYAHRGDHETAMASKAILNIFYGGGLERSYFHGCSNGGHQALMEAQRYPFDYDAIIAGAPWNQWTHQNIEFISRAIALESLTSSKRAMITNAVITQCGGRDGGIADDGYLNAPQRCDFKPKSLQCADDVDGPNCLTAAEVEAVEKVYAGPVNPDTGLSLFPGFERGSEFAWSGFGSFSNNLFQNMIFGDPTFDFHHFDFADDTNQFDFLLADTINSTNPDLSAFRSHGGKLLLWHGWTDTTLEPRSTVNYFNSVVAVTGGGLSLSELGDGGNSAALHAQRRKHLEDVQTFVRLFMAPGVNHCGGGAGPNSSFAYTLGNAVGSMDADHDILAALDRWVEDDIAPDQLIASHFTSGVADKTRPVCAYPKIAEYKGKGDPNIPASWACVNDWDRFNTDYTQVLENIRLAVAAGNLHGLPNGGKTLK